MVSVNSSVKGLASLDSILEKVCRRRIVVYDASIAFVSHFSCQSDDVCMANGIEGYMKGYQPVSANCCPIQIRGPPLKAIYSHLCISS